MDGQLMATPQDVLDEAIQASMHADDDPDPETNTKGSVVVAWYTIAAVLRPDGEQLFLTNMAKGQQRWQSLGLLHRAVLMEESDA